MGCSTSLAKLILFLFNITFFLLGLASVGVGIWVLVSKNTLFNVVNLLDESLQEANNRDQINNLANQNGLIAIAAIVLIVVGAITVVVAFCGCCGATRESPTLLQIYAVLIAIVLIVQIVAAVLAAVFQSRIKENAEKGLAKMENKFFVSLNDYTTNSSTAKAGVTYLINWLQISLECCDFGTIGNNSDSWWSSNRTWQGRELQRPVTCCKLRNDESKAEAQKPDFNWNDINSKLKDINCPYEVNTMSLHTNKCTDQLISFISSYAVPLIVICVLFALIQLLGIAIACCLVNALRHE